MCRYSEMPKWTRWGRCRSSVQETFGAIVEAAAAGGFRSCCARSTYGLLFGDSYLSDAGQTFAERIMLR